MTRALTNDQRRTAFVIASVIFVAAVIGLGALSRRPAVGSATTPAHSTVDSPAPRIVDAASATVTTQSSNASGPKAVIERTHTSPAVVAPATPPSAATAGVGAAATQLILAQAREFLNAYVVYEVEPLDSRMRELLLQTATSSLVQQLLRHTVRLPARDRPAVGTIQSLELGQAPDSSAVTVDATVDHAGWVSGLILDFQEADGRWLVTGLS